MSMNISPDLLQRTREEVERVVSYDWDSFINHWDATQIANRIGIQPEEVIEIAAQLKQEHFKEMTDEIKDDIDDILRSHFSHDIHSINGSEVYRKGIADGYEFFGMSEQEFLTLFKNIQADPAQLHLFELRDLVRKSLFESVIDYDTQTMALDTAGLKNFLASNGLIGYEEDITSILEGQPSIKVNNDLEEYLRFYENRSNPGELTGEEILTYYLDWNGLSQYAPDILRFVGRAN